MSCSLADSPHRRRLLADVRERLFRPARPDGRPGFGARVELIPLSASGLPVPIQATGDRDGSLPALVDHARSAGWHPEPGAGGVPAFRTAGGGRITYGPGGQVRYGTPPLPSVDDVVADLDGVVPPLVGAAGAAGIRLEGVGIDPLNSLDAAALQLPDAHHTNVLHHLGRSGDAGPRLMLQSAAVRVEVDAEPGGPLRLPVLNAAAPFLTAVFANSRRYGGGDSGHASYRAALWRRLDRRRTGPPGSSRDPAAEYLDFALEAPWILGPPDREPEPFVERLLRGEASLEDWRAHLDTLEPAIRPGGQLQVRCIDALPPEWYAAPLAVVAGCVADERAMLDTLEALEGAGADLPDVAARRGPADPRLAAGAADLFGIALAGGERSGAVGPLAVERARAYLDRFTARGRAPADGSAAA